MNDEYVHRECAPIMCIEHIHVNLVRRRRYVIIQHGGSIRLANVHGKRAGMPLIVESWLRICHFGALWVVGGGRPGAQNGLDLWRSVEAKRLQRLKIAILVP